MRRHLLLSFLCGSLCAGLVPEAVAQVRNQFFYYDSELVVNGTADQDASTGWTVSDGWQCGGVTTPTYAACEFAPEHLPAGMSADDRLFMGTPGSFWTQEDNSASHQYIEIPDEVISDIQEGCVTAYMSALLGGWKGQDDHAAVVYSFLSSDSTELQRVVLGPVLANDRNNTTSLKHVEQNLPVPAGTVFIKVEVQITEAGLASSSTDGYADNISLRLSTRSAAPVLTMRQSVLPYGEQAAVHYENLPSGVVLSIYKNRALQPMGELYTVNGDGLLNKGVFEPEMFFGPGDYRVQASSASGDSLTSTFFTVGQILPEISGKQIFVMSDIHVMHPDLLVKEGAAFESYLNSDRKLLVESPVILSAMIDTILDCKPDLVLIPGDLTKDGERLSHELVRENLARLKQAGIQVCVVPGNHDVNNPHALVYNGDVTEYAETVSREEFAEIYQDYGYGSGAIRDPHSLSYLTEVAPDLVVLGIDACRYEDNRFISAGDSVDVCVTDGRLKPETLAWISEKNDSLRKDGKQVLAIMHHNLVEHFNMQATIASPYVVTNDSLVRETLMKAGVRVVFTGHFHISDIAKDYNSQKTDSIYDIATGSTVTYTCPFREIVLSSDNRLLSVRSGLLKSIHTEDSATDDFDLYARDKVANGINPMVKGLVHDYWGYINQTVDSLLQKYPIGGVINRPSTPEELSDLLLACFEKPAIRAYLTFSEGNESEKKTDDILAEIKDGLDIAVEQLVNGSVMQSVVKGMIESEVYPLLDSVVGSILQNVTHKGTDRENVSDDLNLLVELPVCSGTGVSLPLAGEGLLEVFPTFTSSDVLIRCSEVGREADILIFDASGRMVAEYRPVVTEGCAEVRHSFAAKGVYFVKLAGSGSVKKVIVQ